mmetsp:Transcript_29371/g.45390  ORF Transcript_29371/g.45390 Transcript_29371/m.45390 type:complete len:600 (-) Transcript_29371:32-1831(-)|eukprot:CAMPEP_0201514548 /NCGR_PEP_ID=MMETSP0161_2-20130828/6360_1 /ASSEMBLY_ACC=CAM_ASM_000251 /TAXON_ID=180227 /ORGANISM="Neoparamoeba aestuarina, Strain SoJaBio B1-5/56/2" /LENGTH=599 /DNA_ID=CAMNT_0047911135 /DNA_START=197 /DNA_END=1996 /DNA_ORIENTATION=+
MAFTQFGPPQIGAEEITIGESIGSGCFGGVFKGFCRGINVAVKIPHRGVVNPSQFRKEVNVLSKINHPNVCLFMGACLSRPKVMIVSELMCGDVENLVLNKKNKFKLSELIGFAIDAARGMAWLHGNKPPVFHRDLKIANLLYDETMKVKVCDFGLADFKPTGGQELYDDFQPKGTPLYMAPEVMNKDVITEKADIYSFSIVMWEIFTRTKAYGEFEDFVSFRRATEEGNRPKIPNSWPSELKSLLEDCWKGDPNLRPDFTSVVRRLEKIFADVETKEYEAMVGEKVLESTARDFWKKHFLKQVEVRWEDFEAKLLDEFKINHLFAPCPLSSPPSSPKSSSSPPSSDPSPPASSSESSTSSTSPPSEEPKEEEEPFPIHTASSAQLVVHSKLKMGIVRRELVRRVRHNKDPSESHEDFERDPLLLLLSMKELLTSDSFNPNTVSREAFGKVTECFGPVNIDMLYRIRNMLSYSCFHGFLPTDRANNILKVKKAGSYLVRFSNNRSFKLILTRISRENIVTHHVITKTSRGWLYEDRTYDTIPNLINNKQQQLYLHFPCPGPFSWIFATEEASLGGYEPYSSAHLTFKGEDELNKLDEEY